MEKTRTEFMADALTMNPKDFHLLNNGEGPYNDENGLDEDGQPTYVHRYMLVETSHSGQEWITLHHTPEDAAAYHDGQEAPEYWGDCELVDLDTGQGFFPQTTTTWHPSVEVVENPCPAEDPTGRGRQCCYREGHSSTFPHRFDS